MQSQEPVGGNGKYQTGKLVNDNIDHPAMFPKQLAIDQVNTWTNKGDLVLDPFIGSGTTAVACREREREWVGFEISQKYCEMANERLSNQVVQNSLFDD